MGSQATQPRTGGFCPEKVGPVSCRAERITSPMIGYGPSENTPN